MNNNSTTEIRGFDLAKILMAILIVAAHTDFLVEWPTTKELLSYLESIGVPMFFAISSYLFVRKLDIATEVSACEGGILIHSLKRLLILFAIWYILMLPMTYDRFFTKATLKETIYAITLTCTFNGYWFIKALIFNTIIIYYCRHTKRMIILFVLSLAIFIFFSYNYIYNFWHAISVSPYYSFYFHTCMFCIGALYARFESHIHLASFKVFPLIFLWLLLLCLMHYQWGAPIFRFCSVIVLFPVFFNLNLPQISKNFWKTIRSFSVIIYMVQFVLIYLYDIVCIQCFQGETLDIMQHSVVRFFIILSLACAIAWLITRLERIPRLALLKYMH